MTINGRKISTWSEVLSYEDLVDLAGKKGQPTVICRTGSRVWSMHPGDEIDTTAGGYENLIVSVNLQVED